MINFPFQRKIVSTCTISRSQNIRGAVPQSNFGSKQQKKSDKLIETVVPQIALTKPMIHKKGKAIKSINESAPEESLTTTGKIVFTV